MKKKLLKICNLAQKGFCNGKCLAKLNIPCLSAKPHPENHEEITPFYKTKCNCDNMGCEKYNNAS